MITCRRATKDDVELFREVRLKALKDSPDAYGSTYESALKRDHASWTEQLHSTVAGGARNTQFAFHGTGCVGIAALYREPDARSGDIIMMWVDPNFRGSAAASAMVEELLKWAGHSGFRTVALNVTDTNSRAIQFYKNMNFVVTGEAVAVDVNRNLRGIRMETQLG